MENEKNENISIKAVRGIFKKSFKFLLIIVLIFTITPVILVFSLREVYKDNTSDSAFKNHKEEYEQLKGESD